VLKKTLLALAVVAAVGLGSEARAALLFTFTSTPTVPPGGVDILPETTITYSGNTGGSDAEGLGSDIKVSFIDLTAPTMSGFISSPFSFDVTVTDTTTGALLAFTVAGTMSGNVTPDSSSLTFMFSSGTQMQSATVGGQTVTYTLDPKFLDVPTVETGGVTKQGSLTAHVSATITNVGVPEIDPGSAAAALTLLASGFSVVTGRRRRRADG
jgi:hypothetical protein